MKAAYRIPVRAAVALAMLCAGQISAPALRANSATGVDTSLGNSLSRPTQRSEDLDADWLKTKHTPTGQMFNFPYAAPKADETKPASDWNFSGQLEFGFISGDANERNAEYRI